MRIILLTYFLSFWVLSCTQSHAGNNVRNVNLEKNSDSSLEDTRTREVVRDKKFSPIAFIQYVINPQNGLIKTKEINNLIYSAQFKPLEYIVCLEQKKEQITNVVWEQRKLELEGMQYIDLKIELKHGGNELLKYDLQSKKEYEDRVDYFSFKMQNDICLVQGKDTLPCQLFHFERIYDVAPYSTFLLAFPNGKDSLADRTLIFYDHGFNNGILKFFFDNRDLINLPQLQVI